MTDNIRIKICGMKFPGNIRHAIEINPDYLGFIFYPGSKRFIGYHKPSIINKIPERIAKVGVFVNEDQNVVKTIARKFGLNIIQLHGYESRDYCLRLYQEGFRIIKAFGINSEEDFIGCNQYEDVCEFFLFDTQGNSYGGTGKKFNWGILNNYMNQKPFFLSGGIGPGDTEQIRNIHNERIHAVDINSQFEIEPGLKDIHKIRLFIRQLSKES